MSKRRTRRQKETAHHQFLISWKHKRERGQSEPYVKRQFKDSLKSEMVTSHIAKSPENLAREGNGVNLKRDIVKSLSLASLILASEIVIYLAWSR